MSPKPPTPAICSHLNCLVYHPSGVCTCNMARYCPICRGEKQEWTLETIGSVRSTVESGNSSQSPDSDTPQPSVVHPNAPAEAWELDIDKLDDDTSDVEYGLSFDDWDRVKAIIRTALSAQRTALIAEVQRYVDNATHQKDLIVRATGKGDRYDVGRITAYQDVLKLLEKE